MRSLAAGVLLCCVRAAHAQFSRAYMRDEFITHSSGIPPSPFSSEWMIKLAASNSTLLDYLYPKVRITHRASRGRACSVVSRLPCARMRPLRSRRLTSTRRGGP